MGYYTDKSHSFMAPAYSSLHEIPLYIFTVTNNLSFSKKHKRDVGIKGDCQCLYIKRTADDKFPH